MRNKILILGAMALPLLGLVSCSKEEAPALPDQESQQEQTISISEAVDVLTKSISKEDLRGLSLFIKEGTSGESIYLEIEKEGRPLVSGEVSLTAGALYKVVGLNLTVMGQIPVTGTVDALKLGVYMAEAGLSLWNGDLLQKALDRANGTMDIQVAWYYHVEFMPVQDAESGRYSIETFLVQDSDPDMRMSISELIEMFS